MTGKFLSDMGKRVCLWVHKDYMKVVVTRFLFLYS